MVVVEIMLISIVDYFDIKIDLHFPESSYLLFDQNYKMIVIVNMLLVLVSRYHLHPIIIPGTQKVKRVQFESLLPIYDICCVLSITHSPCLFKN